MESANSPLDYMLSSGRVNIEQLHTGRVLDFDLCIVMSCN